jgi:hypothetical protein
LPLPPPVAAAFAAQVDWCRLLDSPFTARLMEAAPLALAEAPGATAAAIRAWPGEPVRDALVLRLAGGLHALVRAGRAPELAALYPPAPLPGIDALAAALAGVFADPGLDAALRPWLDSAPQTNEVARSGVLMPGLMTIAGATGLPLRLFELGPSAGLNLCLDRWHYLLGAREAGDPASPVRIAPDWRGEPLPDLPDIRVISRAGIDLNPLDVRDPATADRLLAYVWPDQPARVARAAAAIAAVAADPPPIAQGDAAAFVAAQVAPVAGSCGVVFHSIAFQYFPADSRAAIAAHMAGAGAEATPGAPLAWLRYEMEEGRVGALPTLRLTLWRGGPAQERLLAHAHPHGTFVQWA